MCFLGDIYMGKENKFLKNKNKSITTLFGVAVAGVSN